jgi:hypothetical protein
MNFDQMSEAQLEAAIALLKKSQQPKEPAGILDRVQATVSGWNKGLFTGLPGSIVDTGVNAANLVRAGAGVAERELGLDPNFGQKESSPAADLPELIDPAQVPWSSSWLQDKIRQGGVGAAIDPSRPDDALSRYLHAGGQAVGGAMAGARIPGGAPGVTTTPMRAAIDYALETGLPPAGAVTAGVRVVPGAGTVTAPLGARIVPGANVAPPTTRTLTNRPPPNLAAQGARDAALAGSAGVASQIVGENYPDNPAAAVAAGFAPQATTNLTAKILRGLARGGDAGRAAMDERLQQLEGAGVSTPSVGLASGRRLPQAWESFLSRLPGGAGVIAKNAQDVNEQLGTRAGQLGNLAAPNRGPIAAGTSVQNAIERYRERQQEIYQNMLSGVEQRIIPGSLFPTTNLEARYGQVTRPEPGAPASSAGRTADYGRLNRVVQEAVTDSAATPPRQVPSGVLDANGNPIMATIPGQPGGVPFGALRLFTKRLGDVAYPAANQLLTDSSSGAAKRVYGGARQDITEAARQNDQQLRLSLGQTVGTPYAMPRMERTNQIYSATQKILEDVLGPIHEAKSPEAAYGMIESTAKDAGSVTQQTMASLRGPIRAQVAGTVIDGLGRATRGNQNAAAGGQGDVFSPSTFLSNWTTLKPEAKTALFSGYPQAAEVRRGLDNIAETTAMIREKNKVWPNASNTSSAIALGAMGANLAGAVYSGSPKLIALALSQPALAYGGAKLMTNPMFVTWLSKATVIPDSRQQQHLARLAVNSTTEKDPEAKALMRQLVEQMSAAQ